LEGDDDEGWTRSLESEEEVEEAPCKASLTRQAEHLSAPAEIKFTIPKDRYEEVKTAMCNGSNCCYLVFDRNTGLLLGSESGETDN
jgi:hypothetical protein